jgi:hypothetical protein
MTLPGKRAYSNFGNLEELQKELLVQGDAGKGNRDIRIRMSIAPLIKKNEIAIDQKMDVLRFFCAYSTPTQIEEIFKLAFQSQQEVLANQKELVDKLRNLQLEVAERNKLAGEVNLTHLDLLKAARAIEKFVASSDKQREVKETLESIIPGNPSQDPHKHFPPELTEIVYKFLDVGLDDSISLEAKEIVTQVCLNIVVKGLPQSLADALVNNQKRIGQTQEKEKAVQKNRGSAGGAANAAAIVENAENVKNSAVASRPIRAADHGGATASATRLEASKEVVVAERPIKYSGVNTLILDACDGIVSERLEDSTRRAEQEKYVLEKETAEAIKQSNRASEVGAATKTPATIMARQSAAVTQLQTKAKDGVSHS